MERETLLKGKIKNKKPVPVNGTGLKKKLNSSCDRLERYRRSDLALGFFGDFFFLGALFLFFLLELVVDEFEDGHFGAIADANAGGDNTRVASGPIRKLRCDVGEELLRDVRRREIRSGLAARL